MQNSVLILDDDSELGTLFRDLFELNGTKVLIAESLADVVSMKDQVLNCKTIFLDIELGTGKPDGIEAYRWLLDCKFKGRIFFLTGHGKNHPLVAKARLCGSAEVLTKPVPPKDL